MSKRYKISLKLNRECFRIIHIDSNVLKIIILLIPFFKPGVITAMYNNSGLHKFFMVWSILAFVYVAMIFMLNYKTLNSFPFYLVLIYEIWMFVACMCNHVDLRNRIINMSNQMGILMIYMYYAKYEPKAFVRANYILLSSLVIINALLTILFPDGLNYAGANANRINFLGIDNMLSLIILLTIYFCMMYKEMVGNNIFTYFIVLVSILTQLYYFSGSGVVATVFISVYMICIMKKKYLVNIVTPLAVFLAYILCEIILVLVQNHEAFSILCNLLGKNTTFTDRIYFWRQSIIQVVQSPILGSGTGVVLLWSSDKYSHNNILDILLKGGAIGLIIWFLMVFYPFVKLYRLKVEKWSAFTLAMLFAFFLIGLMEGLEDRMGFNAFIACVCIMPQLMESVLFRGCSDAKEDGLFSKSW